MKAEHVNAFLNTAKNVLESFTGTGSITTGRPSVKYGEMDAEGIFILVGITGELKGITALSMSEDTAMELSKIMMAGFTVESFDDLAKSAISEMANIIAVNCASALSKLGIMIDISPPTMVVGVSNKVNTSAHQAIRVPLILGGHGTINMCVSIEDK